MALRFFRAIAMTIVCFCGLNQVQAQVSFDTESTFLQLNTSNGNVFGENATGHDLGQRYQVSYVNPSNLGGRITHWEWNHGSFTPSGTRLGYFNTYNFDAEAFKRVNFTKLSTLEISGGLRYNETQSDSRVFGTTNENRGYGGLFGVRGSVKTRTGGELYTRSKWAVILGDGRTYGALPNPAYDLVRNQWEVGLGYQHNLTLKNGMVLTPRVGAEWITFTGSEAGIGLPGTFNDVALGGLVFGVGITR